MKAMIATRDPYLVSRNGQAEPSHSESTLELAARARNVFNDHAVRCGQTADYAVHLNPACAHFAPVLEACAKAGIDLTAVFDLAITDEPLAGRLSQPVALGHFDVRERFVMADDRGDIHHSVSSLETAGVMRARAAGSGLSLKVALNARCEAFKPLIQVAIAAGVDLQPVFALTSAACEA